VSEHRTLERIEVAGRTTDRLCASFNTMLAALEEIDAASASSCGRLTSSVRR